MLDRSRWVLGVTPDDHLVLGGCDLVALATTYGTPLHVVDEQRLRSNYRRFRAAFETAYPATRVFYSYKTNCIPGVLRVLHDEGCGAEVISPYEAWLANRLGVKGSDTIYNGVARSQADFEMAIHRGIGLINVDSVDELERLERAAAGRPAPVNIGLRVYPPVGWRAHFGIDPRRDRLVDRAAALRASAAVRLSALHAHIGSGVRRTVDYERLIETLCALMRDLKARAGIAIDTLDLGGGYGVPTVKVLSMPELASYKLLSIPPRPPRAEQCPTIEAFGQTLTATLRDRCARDGMAEPSLLLEPGRILTGDAQLLLVTVKEIKARGARTAFAIADGGMQNVAFPLSYEYHHCFLANRASAPLNRRYVVVGPLCSPQDLLYRNWPFPVLESGDVLAVMDAGAYFTSFANNFAFPRPAVVGVADGRHRLLHERETFEHVAAGASR